MGISLGNCGHHGMAEGRLHSCKWNYYSRYYKNVTTNSDRSKLQGDLGFDPLGLSPSDPKDFRDMRTKELQNGRLAMLATAGFIAQELVDGKTVLGHFGL